MNIVFLGSSHFAVPTLEALLMAGHKVSCVVTQPDKSGGRGLNLIHTVIKDTALKNKLKVYQPEDINKPEAIKFLRLLKPELLVVVSYGQILSQEVLDIPKIIPINLHASLLPKYRGAAPINWAIINGEETSGVTVMKITKKMDAGKIILQRELAIEDQDTAISLEEKLSKIGSGLLMEAVDLIKNKTYKLLPQDETKASFAPKLKKRDGLLNWNEPAINLYNRLRGCLGWPGAFTYYKGKLLKVYKMRLDPLTDLPKGCQPGEIIKVFKDSILVAAKRSCLAIEELQIEGKRKMAAEEFIAGHRVEVGEILGGKLK